MKFKPDRTLVVVVLVCLLVPTCGCLWMMESFFTMANPDERPSQIVLKWFRPKEAPKPAKAPK